MSCGRFDSTDVLTRKPPRDIFACMPSSTVCVCVCVVYRRLYRTVGKRGRRKVDRELVTKNSLIEEKLENMKLETGGGGLCIDKPDNLEVFRF